MLSKLVNIYGGSMIKVSSKLDCGLRALTLLARSYNREVLSLNKISKLENIPRDFLAQIMLELKRKNIVESYKGVLGGYVLKRSPSEITLKEIFEALEGPIQIIDCIHTYDSSCTLKNSCLNKKIWVYIEEKLINILEDLTLEDIILGIERKEEFLSL